MPRWRRRARRSSEISTDSVEKLAKFKAEFNLPFILLSDEKGTVVEQYPGKIPVLGVRQPGHLRHRPGRRW